MRMYYKPNFDETIRRFKDFWAGRMNDRVLLQVDLQETFTIPDPQVYAPDLAEMLRHSYLPHFELRRGICDDSFPGVRVDYGSGLKAALLGAELAFSGGSGFAHPLITDLNAFSEIRFDRNSYWACKLAEGTEYLNREAGNRFAVGRTNIGGPIEVASLLRGQALYTDFVDSPRQVHKLLEAVTQAIIDVQDFQFERVPAYNGGFLEWWKFVYFPGRSVLAIIVSLSTIWPTLTRTSP